MALGATNYRQVPSLREYLLISQHRVLAERYTRSEDNRWTLTDFTTLIDSITLASVDCTLALTEVYDKVVDARLATVKRHGVIPLGSLGHGL